ncbi:MAG: hypothetical protein JNM17_16075 [Archangium sp.]|nr:hypothetical protein [Archangium sp.]
MVSLEATVARLGPPTDHLADLCLARAAAAGFAPAVEAFERSCIAPLRLPDDVLQELRLRLLTGVEPRLVTYLGNGPLRAWTRAVATRLSLQVREVELGVDEPLERIAAPVDVALDVARREHHAAFQQAFAEAMRALTPGDRTLLRLHYLQSLGLERLATMYRCHRATIVRRLASIRDAVFSSTRALLVERLELSGSELESLLLYGKEQLTVSLGSVRE